MTEFVRIKRVAEVRYGLGQPPRLSLNGIPIIRATNISQGRITTRNMIHTSLSDLPTERAPLLSEGEILVVRSGALTGDSARIPAEWSGSAPGYDLRVTPNASIESRYLAYCLLSRPVIDQMKLASSRAAQPHLNAEELGDIKIPAVSFDNQSRIADFLDSVLTKLDDLVNKKRHLVRLLNERIDSRVLQHVGQSEIVQPEVGSPTLPIKRILTKVTRPPIAGSGVITAYRDGQVTERGARRAEGYTMSASTEPSGQQVHINDVVVHGLDGFAGAIGTAEASGTCSPVYHVCTPRDGGDPKFIGRLLRLLALQGYLGNFATSTRERAVDFRNWDLFSRIPVPAVSNSEQRRIGEWITQLHPLRTAIERSTTLAAERRHALITAAVTGQLDVTTASGRNVTEGVSA
ncbi:restriction endonuclease subunit S [Streptomyces sp. NBC_01124]|uniref:restriction endonuclease subunit S n=1 Tax=Streptomyces sp. NBC_01124 TaxID=2903753 RepID=UPI00386451B8|nr:restriction endonuclease subunit S [Streptomyces sp. NBC_01124]